MKPFTFILLLFFTGAQIMAQEAPAIDTLPKIKPDTTTLPTTPSTLLDSLNTIQLAQDSSTTKTKKSKKKLRGFFTKNYPNPKKAMLMSFIVPGSGQVYNKKYWKAPIAIGGTIAMAFVVRDNTRNYRFLREEYKARVDNDDTTVPNESLTNWADEDIRAERDKWNKWKEMSYIGLVLVQALGGVDAFVDAHLHGYEINEDLTMKIKPSMEATPAFGPTVGISVTFQLDTSTEHQIVPNAFSEF